MNSFLHGKNTLKVAPLRAVAAPAGTALISATPPASRPVAPANCGAGHPTVEVVKEGDKVTRLIVVCTCGERLEIDCLYPGGG